ncbi:phosphorylase [Chamaesiphon sp.]|uniref:phosphorylase family protein n=1 Tax=Chamaesiphon sp. TaxID=2814140 RepID=UPI0035934382
MREGIGSSLEIDAILVPQGAEYATVQRACRSSLPVFAIPAGAAVAEYLPRLPLGSWQRVLVMGLCGSLDDRYGIGDVVLYRATISISGRCLECDRELLAGLVGVSPDKDPVLALTSPEVVFRSAAKQQYRQQLGAVVVDMEGQTVQSILAKWGIAVGTIRVVSDDSHHDLPDLSDAFDDRGQLQSWSLVKAVAQDPVAGFRLVQGSLQALRVLDRVARQLN